MILSNSFYRFHLQRVIWTLYRSQIVSFYFWIKMNLWSWRWRMIKEIWSGKGVRLEGQASSRKRYRKFLIHHRFHQISRWVHMLFYSNLSRIQQYETHTNLGHYLPLKIVMAAVQLLFHDLYHSNEKFTFVQFKRSFHL